jgi:hypothetical protein
MINVLLAVEPPFGVRHRPLATPAIEPVLGAIRPP